MKAQVIRITERGSDDPVNRLVLPSKRLVVLPDMNVQERALSGGELIVAADIKPGYLARLRRILEQKAALERELYADYPGLLKALRF